MKEEVTPSKSAVIPISYMQDVYAISPYGDVLRMNPLWWAADDSAAAVATRLGGVAVPRDTTPQTGPALRRWHVSHVEASLVPPGGQRVSDQRVIQLLMDLPLAKMWAIRFDTGCEVNAGYLEYGYERNSAMADGGDSYVKREVQTECAMGITAKRIGKKYPSLFADGKDHVLEEVNK